MYVIIVGLGGIGRNLTALAAEHGDNVVIVDRSAERCNEILEKHDVMAVIGNATDRAILMDAGIDRAGAFIATTHDDHIHTEQFSRKGRKTFPVVEEECIIPLTLERLYLRSLHQPFTGPK